MLVVISQLLVQLLAFVVFVTIIVVEWQEDMLGINKINNNIYNNTRPIVVVLLVLSKATHMEYGVYQQCIVCSHLLGCGTSERSKEQNERESEEPAGGRIDR